MSVTGSRGGKWYGHEDGTASSEGGGGEGGRRVVMEEVVLEVETTVG